MPTILDSYLNYLNKEPVQEQFLSKLHLALKVGWSKDLAECLRDCPKWPPTKSEFCKSECTTESITAHVERLNSLLPGCEKLPKTEQCQEAIKKRIEQAKLYLKSSERRGQLLKMKLNM